MLTGKEVKLEMPSCGMEYFDPNQIRDLHSWVDPSCSFVCTTLPAFASSAVDAILLLSLSFAVLLNSFLQLTGHKVYNS